MLESDSDPDEWSHSSDSFSSSSGQVVESDPDDSSCESEVSDERHDQLGPCPWNHDNHRDCQCRCARCRNEEVDVVTARRIRRGGIFHRERVITYDPVPAPYHSERSWLPDMPFTWHELYTRNQFMRLPHLITGPIYAQVSGFDEVTQGRGERLSYPHAQDHHSMTIALRQKPCTELIPWESPAKKWADPCPNDRRGEGGQYMGASWPCNEARCGWYERIKLILQWDHRGIRIKHRDRLAHVGDVDLEYGRERAKTTDENPPRRPPTWNDQRWVCQQHREDNAAYWEVKKLLEMHRLPTCVACKKKYQTRYPNGCNSCTCERLLQRWQCRRCYEKKIQTLQRHFKERVCAYYTGRFDGDLLPEDGHEGPGLSSYHQLPHAQYQQLRRNLIEGHPCYDARLSTRCGRRRARNHRVVLHCRSCGGVIVKPRPRSIVLPPKITRLNSRAKGPLQELVFQGRRAISREIV